MKFAASFFAFLLLFTSYLAKAESSEASQLIEKALQRDAAMRQEQQKYQYDLTVLKQKLDENGRVIRSKTTKTTLRPDKEIKFETEINSSDETKRQAEEKEKTVRNAQKTMAVIDFKKLAPRFTLAMGEKDIIRGMECAVVTFTPKPDQPYNSREEKVINKLSGKAWIELQKYTIVKYEAKLTEPVSVAWFFASMQTLECQYESQALADGEIVPASFKLTFYLETAVKDVRENLLSSMSNYRLGDK